MNRSIVSAVGVPPLGRERLSGTGPKREAQYALRYATECALSVNITAQGDPTLLNLWAGGAGILALRMAKIRNRPSKLHPQLPTLRIYIPCYAGSLAYRMTA